MLPIKWTVLIGSTLKLPTVDWEPTRRAGIQLVIIIIIRRRNMENDDGAFYTTVRLRLEVRL